MIKRRLLQMIFLGIKQFRDPYYQGFAAQVSFYLLLSIVPIFLLLTEVLKHFHIDLESTVSWLMQYTGGEISNTLESMLRASSSATLNVMFVVVALWSASRAQFCIMRITNYTFTDGANTGKGYWRERIRAMRTMLVTLFTITFALVILGYGNLLLKAVIDLLNLSSKDSRWISENVWVSLRWIVGLALYFLMVSYNYYILPTKKLKFRKILPGSIFASVGMLLVTLVYSRYTTNVANYDLLYGALSSIVAVMFWFFFLAWVLCLGILVNKVWEDTSDLTKKTPAKRDRLKD